MRGGAARLAALSPPPTVVTHCADASVGTPKSWAGVTASEALASTARAVAEARSSAVVEAEAAKRDATEKGKALAKALAEVEALRRAAKVAGENVLFFAF